MDWNKCKLCGWRYVREDQSNCWDCDGNNREFIPANDEELRKAGINSAPIKSNADRIRSVGDEELAKFIAIPCFCDVDPTVDGFRECGNESCIKHLINWLKQPKENEE